MRVAGRSLTLVDQVLSSASNLLVVVLVARVMTASEFGYFATGYTVLTLVLGVSRAYFGTQVSLTKDADQARRTARDLLGAVLMLGPLVAAAVFAATYAASAGHSVEISLVIAVVTPIVCAQDILRFGASAAGRPGVAVLSDGLWVLLICTPFLLGARLSPVDALLLWAGGAALALTVAAAAFRSVPRYRSSMDALRRPHAVGRTLAVNSVVTAAGYLCVLLVTSAAIGSSSAGSLRGAATAMGPVNVCIAFFSLGLTPHLVRRDRSADVAFCLRAAGCLGLLTALWSVILLTLPSSAGRSAFGDSWPGVTHVLPWTAVEYVLTSVAAAATLGLKVRHRADALARQRLAATAVMLGGGSTAALLSGHVWVVAATLALAAGVNAALGWWQFGRSTQSVHHPDTDPAAGLSSTQVV